MPLINGSLPAHPLHRVPTDMTRVLGGLNLNYAVNGKSDVFASALKNAPGHFFRDAAGHATDRSYQVLQAASQDPSISPRKKAALEQSLVWLTPRSGESFGNIVQNRLAALGAMYASVQEQLKQHSIDGGLPAGRIQQLQESRTNIENAIIRIGNAGGRCARPPEGTDEGGKTTALNVAVREAGDCLRIEAVRIGAEALFQGVARSILPDPMMKSIIKFQQEKAKLFSSDAATPPDLMNMLIKGAVEATQEIIDDALDEGSGYSIEVALLEILKVPDYVVDGRAGKEGPVTKEGPKPANDDDKAPPAWLKDAARHGGCIQYNPVTVKTSADGDQTTRTSRQESSTEGLVSAIELGMKLQKKIGKLGAELLVVKNLVKDQDKRIDALEKHVGNDLESTLKSAEYYRSVADDMIKDLRNQDTVIEAQAKEIEELRTRLRTNETRVPADDTAGPHRRGPEPSRAPVPPGGHVLNVIPDRVDGNDARPAPDESHARSEALVRDDEAVVPFDDNAPRDRAEVVVDDRNARQVLNRVTVTTVPVQAAPIPVAAVSASLDDAPRVNGDLPHVRVEENLSRRNGAARSSQQARGYGAELDDFIADLDLPQHLRLVKDPRNMWDGEKKVNVNPRGDRDLGVLPSDVVEFRKERNVLMGTVHPSISVGVGSKPFPVKSMTEFEEGILRARLSGAHSRHHLGVSGMDALEALRAARKQTQTPAAMQLASQSDRLEDGRRYVPKPPLIRTVTFEASRRNSDVDDTAVSATMTAIPIAGDAVHVLADAGFNQSDLSIAGKADFSNWERNQKRINQDVKNVFGAMIS